ncbi:hypothetical protein MMC08_003461 [Hypocenomyce scalaris]|nr:hypothetical protein [Hypocenomyce scalaris]
MAERTPLDDLTSVDEPSASHEEAPPSAAAIGNEKKNQDEKDKKELGEDLEDGETEEPSLPQEEVPPLPAEPPPSEIPDDGWAPVWDDSAQAYYFYNRFTGGTQWTNPRVPDAQPGPPGVGNYERIPESAPGTSGAPGTEVPQRPYGGYDPAIHGDYDPTAPYAQEHQAPESDPTQPVDLAAIYTATGVFNRFTGKWQPTTLTPENFNDENKSKRQMSAFFDVDAAANSHNGKSLKAERSGKKLTKQELKAFKEKRKEKKEEKRRAWLRD